MTQLDRLLAQAPDLSASFAHALRKARALDFLMRTSALLAACCLLAWAAVAEDPFASPAGNGALCAAFALSAVCCACCFFALRRCLCPSCSAPFLRDRLFRLTGHCGRCLCKLSAEPRPETQGSACPAPSPCPDPPTPEQARLYAKRFARGLALAKCAQWLGAASYAGLACTALFCFLGPAEMIDEYFAEQLVPASFAFFFTALPAACVPFFTACPRCGNAIDRSGLFAYTGACPFCQTPLLPPPRGAEPPGPR